MQKSNKRNRLKKILSDHFFNDKKKKKSEYYTTNIPPKRRYFSKEYEGIINRINKTVARFDDVIKMAREAGKEDIILRLEKIKKAIIERQDLLIKLKKEIESRKKQEDVLNALASNSLSTQDPLSVL
ncbi:MAG: hypothetical protein N3A54_06125, partial [Patescibacteria group bacterium]|nr:hypothetical protein [Patescibacteria group bacterium]